MKRNALLTLILATAFLAITVRTASAQYEGKPKTAMDGVIKKVSGFSEAIVKYGELSGDFAWLAGGKFGITLNDNFWLGAAYFTKIDNSVTADFRSGSRAPNLSFEYGGLDFEYMIATYEMFHFTIQTLVGVGSYSFDDPEGIIDFENKLFYVIEPGFNFELNMTTWLRLQWGLTFRILIDNNDESENLTYRYGRNVQEYSGIGIGDLSKISFQFGAKFGDFNK